MMLFRSADEFKQRAVELGIPLIADDLSSIADGETPNVRVFFEEVTNARIALARLFVSWLGEFRDCEFCISEFGIWPSSEDWNLYQRLRKSCGDPRELYEAPAHLFTSNEKADLETYLSVAIQFGWGGYIIPNPPCAYLFLSHDGWLQVASDKMLARIQKDLHEWEVPFESDVRQ